MQTQALPQVISVSRPAWRRLLEDAIERVAAWRQRRRELEELRSIAQLDHRTLKDIGWPDDMRRRAVDPALRGERW
jgi:uncharacterized protein YjiS (DUF1127 family)